MRLSLGVEMILRVLALLSAAWILAVSATGDEMRPVQLPEDLSLRYDYIGAAVSPRFHHDYAIVLRVAGADSISFCAGYGGEAEAVTWLETFAVPDSTLAAIYDLLLKHDALREKWAAGPGLPGASTEALRITVAGKSYEIPSWVSDTTSANPIFEEIRAAVPGAIWDSLRSRHDRYVAQDPGAGQGDRD